MSTDPVERKIADILKPVIQANLDAGYSEEQVTNAFQLALSEVKPPKILESGASTSGEEEGPTSGTEGGP